jgi:hypothetical protein
MLTTLVVVEPGAQISDSIDAWRRPGSELIVLLQDCDESDPAFRRRIAARLKQVRRTGTCPDEVVLVTNATHDSDALLARGQLIRSVLGLLGNDTRVRLDSGADGDPTARKWLQALADALAGARVSVDSSMVWPLEGAPVKPARPDPASAGAAATRA